jgi:hypothetical protein
MTRYGDTNLVWTDGSAKKVVPKHTQTFDRPDQHTAFSAFFGNDSNLNRGKRCKYATNSLEAELEAIEYTLNKASCRRNLHIVSDCSTAIKLIQNRKYNDKWGAVHRICKLIDKRKGKFNSNTIITHILAHTDNNRVADKKKDKINQYLKMYIDKIGNDINPFLGNIQADKLAYTAVNEEVNWKFDRRRTHIRNSKTLSIKCANTLLPADVKDKCMTMQQHYWTTRRKIREPNNMEIPEVTAFTTDNIPNRHKLYKLQGLSLGGKHQCYYNLKSKKCPLWVTAKYQSIYQNTTCEFCKLNQPEDTIHIIGQCPKWEKHRRIIRTEMDTIFKKANLPPPETFWLNCKDDYTSCRDSNDEIRHYWKNKYKLYASTGRIPHTMLMEMYEEDNFTRDEWIELFTSITICITSNIANLINSRNIRWKKMVDSKLKKLEKRKKNTKTKLPVDVT